MARIESKLKAGAYPLEEDKRNMLANIIRPYAGDAMQGILVDPFCNNGDTANFLAKSWNMEWYGVEIQKELAREAQEKHGLNRVIYGDAYDVTISHGSIDVLYLNPPYDTDPTTGLFDSNRSEVTALSNLLKYVSLDGMIILVMYAHNVNADIFRHMLKATNRLMFFRFPEPHLGRYNQVVIIGIRQRGYSPPMALEIGDKIDKLLKWFTPEQSMKLPDISKGVPKAYHAHTFGHEKIRLPEPIRVRDWTFVSRKPDWETDTMLFSQFGPQHQKEFLDVCQPPPPHQKIRPPAKMTDNHAAILLNAEII
ncbi:class I SAM-dependent methyltransferase, partial [candidate division WWE3 bacterium]|nr:class I SAM-dependent methyltransferase [candidate division WWE3 bacterium]